MFQRPPRGRYVHFRAGDPADGLEDLPHRKNRPSGAPREWICEVGVAAPTPDPKKILSDGGFWSPPSLVAKVVVTFKLEEGIYSKLREIAEKEGRGVSEILMNRQELPVVSAAGMNCPKRRI